MARAARKAKAKPAGKRAPASGKQRKYSRDNSGRFASTGTGATARGGRLLTAKGNKRKTQTITAAGKKGVIGKPKGLKPGSIKPKAPIQTAAAAKPAAAKPSKAQTKRDRTPDEAKVKRMAARFQERGVAPENPSKVKRLNSIETRQRALAFLAKPNSAGTKAAAAVAQNIANRKIYSTTKPNRNKPGPTRSLGQPEIRERNKKTAQGSATTRAQATKAQTQRQADQTLPKTPIKKAARNRQIENSGSRNKAANSAKVAAKVVKMNRAEPDSQRYKNAVARRDETLALRPKGSNKIAFRSVRQAVSAQRQRSGIMADRVDGKGQGLRKTKTGMTQLGLTGPGKELFRVRPVDGIKRPSGSKYRNSYGRTSTAKTIKGVRNFNGVRRRRKA